MGVVHYGCVVARGRVEWYPEQMADIDEVTTARRYVFQLMLTDSLRGRRRAINDVVFSLTHPDAHGSGSRL